MDEPRDPNLIASAVSTGRLELPRAEPRPVRHAEAARSWWEQVYLGKIAVFMASLLLFILAITLLKEGARGIAPLLRNRLTVNSATNCLGFGWMFAYTIMSGSPVAASALTFFDAGVIDKLGAFAMVTGSRLGASFIVLFIGFLYVLRGRNRATSLSMGLLSLVVTGVTYLPGLILGAAILHTGMLDGVQLGTGALLHSVLGLFIDPIAGFVVAIMPGWAVFLVGLGVVLLSFNLFDRCLPQMALKESQLGRMSRLVYRPWVMFTVGALITLFSMSVSLSLSLLVPLSNRGFVRRENVIPYIMGANITTFIDTLLAAVLLNNPSAFTVVLVEMFSITVVSVAILATVYRLYERKILDFVAWVTVSNRNLALFMFTIFIAPLLMMLI
jgi:sodium-dependent phosphate cotransporter